ncbi:MAG: sialidase family protein, partial [Chloroflexi bacterium]|nr:sialidase family protein [Chloroflexota bacterium]
MWRRFLTFATLAMLVLSVLLTGTASAEESGGSSLTGKQQAAAHGGGPVLSSLNVRFPNLSGAADAQYTPPFAEYLSSSVWLIAKGINPLSADVSGVSKSLHAGGPRLVAPGSVSGQGGAGTLVPYRDPSAKFSRNILIPQDFSGAPLQTEPHLAVNPKDPDHLIAGMIDYNFPSVTTYVSIDGGESWEGPIQVKHSRDEIASAGDPVIGFDRNGNAYLIFISIDSQEFEFGNIVGSAAVSNISMAVSTDGGYSWSPGSPANPPTTIQPDSFFDTSGRVRGTLPITFLDKPWISVGPDPDDPSRDMISISYTKFVSEYGVLYIGEVPSLGIEALESVIEVVTSRDLGITWSAPYEVSPRMRQQLLGGQRSAADASAEAVSVKDSNGPITTPGGQVINVRNRLVQGSQPAIAPDGTSYVAWMDSTDDGPFEGLAQMYVARSDDGGRTWTAGRRASTFLETGFSPRTTFFRYWGSSFAQLTVGPGGQVYVGYIGLPAGAPEDDGDLFVVRSLDKGLSWETPVKVTDDKTNRMQFFPSISAGPDGKLHAMWGDMRDDSKELQYHIYYAVSEDDGKTFGLNSRVTDSASNPNWGFPGGQFIGDYFSIQATASDVYMVWADTRLGEFSGTNQKIAFARQRQVPRPSIFLNPPEGAGGPP